MIQIPEIKRKKAKAPYRKPDSVKELEAMADAEAIRLHPTCPHLAPRTFRDDSANGLTGCVVKYITLRGGFCSRLNNTGIFDKRLGRYRPGTSRKGLPDVMATSEGKSLMVEVKIGRDKMSESQKKIRDEQNRSGGFYFVAHSFTDFKIWFDSI